MLNLYFTGEDCKIEEREESKEPAAAPSSKKADTKEKPEGQKVGKPTRRKQRY